MKNSDLQNLNECYINIVNEKKEHSNGEFEEFAGARLQGAEKIVKNAKQKGGAAMLTYHHFNVKLPHYKKAEQGKFDAAAAKKQLKQLTKQLNDAVDGKVEMQQIEFQKNVGLIEVLGELLIKMQSK
jgi:hypothetical protein